MYRSELDRKRQTGTIELSTLDSSVLTAEEDLPSAVLFCLIAPAADPVVASTAIVTTRCLAAGMLVCDRSLLENHQSQLISPNPTISQTNQ